MAKTGHWLLAVAALSIAVVAIVFVEDDSDLPAAQSETKDQRPEESRSVHVTDSDNIPVPSHLASPAPEAAMDTEAEGDSSFRVDDAGRLIVNEQTRLNIEALIARSDPAELHEAVREQTEHLPPDAGREATELVEKALNYQQAQRQSYPPDYTPLTAEDSIRQLEGLHALRESFFGSEVAQHFYGREELISREMIELMRIENDPSLSAVEKKRRSDALRERLPEVATIERRNRDSAATEDRQQDRQ